MNMYGEVEAKAVEVMAADTVGEATAAGDTVAVSARRMSSTTTTRKRSGEGRRDAADRNQLIQSWSTAKT